jgi:membrane-associated phospholipid phosphatase
VAGLACLVGVVLLGFVAGHTGTVLDRALEDTVHRLVVRWGRGPRRVVAAIAAERGRSHGAYLTALLPLTLAALTGLVAARRGLRLPRQWFVWASLLLVALPLDLLLRVAFGRIGPHEEDEGAVTVGSYPSGAALLVALGWLVATSAIARLRPRWRGPFAALGVVALLVHGVARVAVGAHWATDILGSYVLAAGVAMVAGGWVPP